MPRGWGGNDRKSPYVDCALQLEIPSGEFWWRSLPFGLEPLVGAEDGDYSEAVILERIEYGQQVGEEAKQRLGDRWKHTNPVVGTVFPNFSLIRTLAQEFRVWHPRGPEEIQICSFSFVDKAAPQEAKDALRLASIRSFSPSGNFEQDDMDN